MRFNGEWLQCDDGSFRPVIRAEILTSDGYWRAFELLVDTGADRTVISANVLESLSVEAIVPQDRIGGVGGWVDSVSVNTKIRLLRDDGQRAVSRSKYFACTDREALDMSVLGRDILDRELNNFTNNNSVGTRHCRVPTRELALNSILIPLDMFALIVDRRNDVVAIVGGQHTYTISSQAPES